MKNPNTLSRRSLIKGAGFAGTAAAAGFAAPSALADHHGAEKKSLPKGSVVLFQGDSITDAGRSRKTEGKANDQSMFGRGYPQFIAAYSLATHATSELKIYNRGISGNKVPDLDARWDKDCLDLKPALLSILIGVNDIWHKLNGRYKGTVDDYEKGYTALLERTKKAMPEVILVVCEPFVLKCGSVKDNWFPEMDERRAAAKRVAEAADAIFVPFQKMFDDAVAAGTKPEYWARDGVHPSLAGHGLMAKTWIDTVGA